MAKNKSQDVAPTRMFSDSHDFSEALRPRIANQLVCSAPKMFHSSLKVGNLGENCSITSEKHRSLSGSLQPKTDAYFTFLRQEARMYHNGQDIDHARSPLVFQVHHPSRVSDISYQSPASFYSLYIDQTHLNRLFGALTQEDGAALLKLESARFVSEAARRKVFSLIKEGLGSALENQGVETTLMESFIESIDLHHTGEPVSYCNRIARKAHEIIIATPGRRISLTEICQELKVASRSLQQGFTDVYGMGFTEYHQLYRLHRLRAYLRKNGWQSGELTQIIGSYGFNHAGRLSQYYKKTFGVVPSKESKRSASEAQPIFRPSRFS